MLTPAYTKNLTDPAAALLMIGVVLFLVVMSVVAVM
jgi:hypothetical protein